MCPTRRGYGRPQCGVAEARGAVVYFLDDDCVRSRLVGRAVERSCLWRSRFAAARVPGQPGSPRLEYLSTDGPVLSPGLAAGPRAICQLEPDCAARGDRESRCLTPRSPSARVATSPLARASLASACATTEGPRDALSAVHGLSDYLGKVRHYGTGTSQYFRRWSEEEPMRACSLSSRAAPASAARAFAAGTAYLVARNLPQCPDALPLSPLLFVGQVWWQWGGYEAMKMEQQAC